MPTTFQWADNERSIALTTIQGHWTWEEFEATNREFVQALHSVSHPVYCVTDLSDTHHLPPNALTHGARLMREMPDHVDCSIVIVKHAFIRSMSKLFTKMYRGKHVFIMVGTMEEAEQVIHERMAALGQNKY